MAGNRGEATMASWRTTNECAPPLPPRKTPVSTLQNPHPLQYTRYLISIGWVGGGRQRRCKTRLSLRELRQPGYRFFFFFFFWRSPPLTVELDHFFVWGEASLRTRGMMVSRSVYMVRHPRGSYAVSPLLSLEMATPEIKSTQLALSFIRKKVRFKSGS